MNHKVVKRGYKLQDGKVVETDIESAQVLVVVDPIDEERRELIAAYGLDEHTLSSSLDPDELSRLEFEPEHVAIIYKRPLHYSPGSSRLRFKAASAGLFVFKERVVMVVREDTGIFSGRLFNRVTSLSDLWLKILYASVSHFLEHLREIYAVTEELEKKINTSLENRYLLQLFALEKSMVFYQNSIITNGVLMERIKINATKLGLSPEEIEFLDDMAIENNQCQRQADIYSNILASLMDARASIVGNNLNQLIKTLNILTIAIMIPTLVVSAFSMNVGIPLQRNPYAFWMILGLAAISVSATALWWFTRKTR